MSINIKNLKKSFEDQTIFDNFDININRGEIVGITGSSGCGKTTLLRIIAGLDKDYSADTFEVDGKISFLFQEDRLIEWKNIYQNISFVVEEIIDKKNINEKAKHLLMLSHLYDDMDKYPSELSGGMKRRCALCRSFIYPFDILIMDEPFSGLDEKTKSIVARDFLSLLTKDNTAIIVTHDKDIINLCSRVINL